MERWQPRHTNLSSSGWTTERKTAFVALVLKFSLAYVAEDLGSVVQSKMRQGNAPDQLKHIVGRILEHSTCHIPRLGTSSGLFDLHPT